MKTVFFCFKFVYLGEAFVADGASVWLFTRVPACMQDQRCFVRKFGIAVCTLKRLFFAVNVAVIV